MKCSGLLGRRWNKYLLIENLVLPGRAKARACAPAVSKTRTVFVAAPNRARTRLIPGVHPRTAPVFPGGEKARGCAGQFAHAPSRRRAVCTGRLVTRDAACSVSAAHKAVCPVCFFPARLRRASRAPAVSKSRTRRPGAGLSATAGSSPALLPVMRRLPAKRFALSASSPRACGEQVAHRVYGCAQSRTHAIGFRCVPAHDFCFPGQGESPRLRRASRAPCLWLRPASHARCCFRVRARAWLLFSRAGRKLSFCSLQLGENPPGESPGASPEHRNARKAELCSFGFSGVSPPAGDLRPKGPRKPASSEKKGEIGKRAQASSFAQKRLKS